VAEERRRQYLDAVATELQRLITVTKRMLSFCRPSDNAHTPTEVNDLVVKVLELAKNEAAAEERLDGGRSVRQPASP